MASCGTLELQGSLRTQSDACGSAASCGGVSAGTKVQPLGLRCVSSRPIVSSDCGIQIATPGTPGDNFIDLPVVDSLDRVEVLYLGAATQFVWLRIVQNGDGTAQLATAGTFPTGFGGGETLELQIDGAPSFTTTFTAAAQSAQDVANEINAAAALAGYTRGPASVDATSGQVVVASSKTGPVRPAGPTFEQGSVVAVSGTALATLGLTAGQTVYGSGSDIRVAGTFLNEFGRGTDAPDRILISGSAEVEILAAGTTP